LWQKSINPANDMTAKTEGLLIKGSGQQANLYKRMIEEIRDYAIILMDADGIILNWNKGAEKIKQYSEKEILGKHFSMFYLEDDIRTGLPQRLVKEAGETGSAEQEGWRKRKDGTKFWGSTTITAIHDDNKIVIGYCKVTRDLTEKKINSDNLRMSEERYHQMIAEVQDYAIILLSPDGIIQNWNTGAEKIKGYKAAEVIGRKFELFYTHEDRESGLPDKLLNLARLTGKATQEGWRVRKDGTRFWGTIVITALHNKDNQLIGFSKVTRDLTEKKIAEEKLAAYTTELEIQNSELEQFAYVASHDLQEPLRKIRTFTELIQENLQDEDFVKTYLNKLDRSAARMTEQINDLLNYSRVSKTETLKQPINLNHLLEQVKEDFEILIQERNAVIESEPLPIVFGNPSQIGQVVSNLISNSIKFCVADPRIKISYTLVKAEDIPEIPVKKALKYIVLKFTDNGIGIDPQYNAQIFGLFQRLHGKETFAGTGIGLALCKKIVEKHEGFIAVQSELDKGTSFILYLPFEEGQSMLPLLK
jgi:PAS domain S-box-containing protein